MDTTEIIRSHYRKIGSIGGKSGSGKSKARTTEQASNAARIRWAKDKAKAITNTASGLGCLTWFC